MTKPPLQSSEDLENEMIRLRIKIARLRVYPVQQDAADAFVEATRSAKHPDGMSHDIYRSYEKGRRRPRTPVYRVLEQMFGVKPPGWLAAGSGESHDELLDMLEKAEDDAKARRQAESPAKRRKGRVNRLTEYIVPNTIKLASIRYIPLLSAGDISRFLVDISSFTGETVPVPTSIGANTRLYAYTVPHNDRSMVSGSGPSIGPGTLCVFDPDEDVLAGNVLLVSPRASGAWLLRVYQGALPLSAATEFTLTALNPDVEAIRVTDKTRWEFGGRLIYSMHKW
jgi:hypothetical protein